MRYNYKAYERVLHALRELSFNEFGASSECVDEVIEYFDDSVIKLKDWQWGATKLVLIPQKGDYVIKIPFSGDYSYDFNDETGEEERIFEEFCFAKNDSHWDYCRTEVEAYKLAREFGMEKYFLETFCIGDICGHPIYVQEKADYIGPCKKGGSKTTPKEAHEIMSSLGIYSELSNEWIAAVIDITEEQELVDFFQFLDENSLDYDLHGGNVGYKNGRPVIVDYAGFFD